MTSIELDFTSVALIGSQITISHRQLKSVSVTTNIFYAQAFRTTPFTFGIGSNTTEQAELFTEAIRADLGDLYVVEREGTIVKIRTRLIKASFFPVNLLDLPIDTKIVLNNDIKQVKTRSPYVYITPPAKLTGCQSYEVQRTTTDPTYVSYIDCATGELETILLSDNNPRLLNCSKADSVNASKPITIFEAGACPGNFTFTKIDYSLYNYRNNITSVPSFPTWRKSKNKVVNTQSNIWIDQSGINKFDIEADIDKFLLSTPFNQAQKTGLKESKWLYTETEFTNNLTKLTNFNKTDVFYLTDGYVDSDKVQQNNKVLQTGNKRQLNKGSIYRLHFISEGLVSISYQSTNTLSTTISFDSDYFFNDIYTQSILINTIDDYSKYTFVYADSTEVYEFYMTDECKFDKWDCIFKNKYGFLETISFNKKTTREIKTTRDNEYLVSLVDFNGNYNIKNHSMINLNIHSDVEITLNTDYLDEYMNEAIKEMNFSQYIWLRSSEGVYPVNNIVEAYTQKSGLNDKGIQYTMTFKLSNRAINNIK